MTNRYSNIQFRCPSCRAELSPATTFPIDQKYFEAEVLREMKAIINNDDSLSLIHISEPTRPY